MWPDNDTNNDFLNFGSVASTVGELIVQANGRPISIGVSGAWGTGKSSLIRLIRRSLEEKKSDRKFIFVEFNAWLYQGYDDARAALIEVIADKLQEQAAGNERALKKTAELLRRVNWLRVAKHGATGAASLYFGVPFGLLGGLLKAGRGATDGVDEGEAGVITQVAGEAASAAKGLWKDAAETSPPKEIQAIRHHFEDVLRELDVTLVVLIDDLDRCLPETTISTLEAIRLFLFLENAAFVIAADNEMIKHAVRKHFEGLGDEQLISYFDKLIQVPIRVPPLGTQEVRAYMMLLFVENATLNPDPEQDKEVKERIRMAVCEQLSKSWQGKRVDASFLRERISNISTDLIEKLDAADRLAPLMTSATGIAGNPRLIKRFLNALSIRKSLSDAHGIGVDEAALAKMLLFERCGNRVAYAEVVASVSQHSLGKPEMLKDWEDAAEAGAEFDLIGAWDEPFAREWLALPPKLSDKDLRGILYVSREHAPLITPQDRLSSEGADLLTALLTEPKMASSLKDRLQKLGRLDLSVVLDRLLERARSEQEWGTPDILDACLAVTTLDAAFGDRLAGFLSERPSTQITPSLVSKISNQPWKAKVFARWKGSDVKSTVKAAITRTESKNGNV